MATTVETSSTTTNPYEALNKSTKNNAAAIAASRAAANKKMALGQSDFLKLMTTQMTHQDPSNPMQNGEFLSQMAQFGTVSGIQDLQNSFASFATSISSDQALQAASLIGRSVSVQTNQAALSAGGEVKGSTKLESSTPNLQIVISDSSTGEMIKTMDLGMQSQGAVPFTWDGTNANGTLVSPGIYNIQASANIDGKNTMLPTDIQSLVKSVTMAEGTNGLKVNLADSTSVNFSQVKQIL
jgi:flagellar basal-body rod modification protein FlgD